MGREDGFDHLGEWMQRKSEVVVERLRGALSVWGLDLVHGFSLDQYNASVKSLYQVPDFGRNDALAVLIGNTKALWPLFLDMLSREPERLHHHAPLNQYVEDGVSAALDSIQVPVAFAVRWAHLDPKEGFAAQTMAEVSGLAARSATHLSVHPRFGPWIALRAVVIFDQSGERTTNAKLPCVDCPLHCLPVLERAMKVQQADPLDERSVGSGQHWRRWLAVRDACRVGRQFRYSESQIRYHYTHDPLFLASQLRWRDQG